MNYDYSILEEKMKSLPEEIQAALSSVEVSSAVKGVGDKHNLKIDQQGILFEQVTYVMLGLTSSKDFVSNLSKEAGIDHAESTKIAADINSEVFGKIRTLMQRMTAENIAQETSKIETSHAAIEKAGDFEIIKEDKLTEHHDGVVAPVASPAGMETVTESPTELVAAIEKAEPITNKTLKEPLSDHLLYTLTGIPGSNLRKTVPPAQSATPSQPNNPPVIKPAVTTPTQPPKPKTFNDIYREPIE